MKFGIRYCNTGRYVDPAQAVELVQAAEAAGFESAWTVEHTIIPRSYDSPYPYTQDGKIPGVREDTSLPDPQIWLAYVAARTTRINLATESSSCRSTTRSFARSRLQRWIICRAGASSSASVSDG